MLDKNNINKKKHVDDLPYVWNNNSSVDLPQTITQNYSEIKSQILKHGAVLFKSFGIDNIIKLESCVAAFPGLPVDYVDGNSPRKKLQGKVYTSTEHPADEFISLHNELSYSAKWPKHLFFCCEIAPLEGGNTVLADSRKILKGLSKETRDAFKSKGVLYIRNLHGGHGLGPSWQDTFETSDKLEIENHCRLNDTIFEWSQGDNLKLIQKRGAILKHPETNEEVWFNQADQFHPSTNSLDVYEGLMELYEGSYHSMPQYVCFGDGTEMPIDMFKEIRKVTEDNFCLFKWEKGDLLLVDNVLAAHGRTPFKGPRKILVSMSA
jgi:alpha-ketoglutarate-dependent taurine dioxygenase